MREEVLGQIVLGLAGPSIRATVRDAERIRDRAGIVGEGLRPARGEERVEASQLEPNDLASTRLPAYSSSSMLIRG